MQISENEIKKLCSQTIYKRGLTYCREGRVHLKTRLPSDIAATVDGSKRYNVHIHFNGDKIGDVLCTCPYYRTMGSACKHIVAVLKTRQAELNQTENYDNENDLLAARLCNEFDAFETKIYHISLTLRITPVGEKISYSAAFSLHGKNGEAKISSCENFIAALCENREYLLSKNNLFVSKECKFDDASEKVINLLTQVYENKTETDFYVPSAGEITFGATTAKEIIILSEMFDTEYIIDGIPYKNPQVLHENPDMLLDVSAVDNNITVSLTENGIALVPDGSIFFFEGKIFYTAEEWRQWFMPFYRGMIAKHRTQLEFAGKNSIDFAAKVLPNIKTKQGVICYNIDELVVAENPKFEIYFDTHAGGITAVIKVLYGNVALMLPSDKVSTDKILVRDTKKEEQVLSYFSDFAIYADKYILNDEYAIFRLITDILPKLYEEAAVFESDSFKKITETADADISVSVSYNEKIDLLEFDMDTKLTEKEIADILKAYYSQNEYYRFKDGRFLPFSQKENFVRLLSDIAEISPGLLKGERQISKFYSLYLAGCGEKNLIRADKSFSDMISKALHTYAKIPENLKGVLRDYQKKGVHWMKQLSKLGLGGILADDMGLGKTLQVIAFVMSENPQKPALVIVPGSLVYNWQNEINKFAPEAKVKIVYGTKTERSEQLGDIKDCRFVITSYTVIKRDIDEYKAHEFSYCFIDEAQYIKNARTKNARAVKQINADGYFALTGTPVENSLSELWSIFDFIMHGYFPNHAEFSAKYEKGGELEKLREKAAPFILRRMKKDVLPELPEKIENTVYADFEPFQRDIYEAFLTEARNELNEITKTGSNAVRILSMLTRLRQICCHPRLVNPSCKKESGKLLLLKDIVLSATEANHRILIFSQFTSMLDIIKEMLLQCNVSFFYLDGSTPISERTDMANRFNGGERRVFLISLKAGGTGLNLIGADTVIHYDPWWNPAVTDQASDRAYRIGQEKAVQVIKLVTKNSIEEKILKLSERKRSLANNIIRENDSLLSSLSKEELLSLFG